MSTSLLPSRGDVVLVDYPFSSGGGFKRRPALRLFDNPERSPNCHARRRENPDDERPAAVRAPVIELYSLRWQIELFFKELKSTLGFHQYQFQKFEPVEGWAELALTTFMYLEWYRVQQMSRRD